MGAYVKKNRDHFDKTFCLVIQWLEPAYQGLYGGAESVFIWEADEDTGRLVLMGDPEVCQQFQHEAGEIIAACPDPEHEWRTYG
jgi:hypothetical protein